MSGRIATEGPRWDNAAWEPEALLDRDVENYLHRLDRQDGEIADLIAERDALAERHAKLELQHEAMRVRLEDAEAHFQNFDLYQANIRDAKARVDVLRGDIELRDADRAKLEGRLVQSAEQMRKERRARNKATATAIAALALFMGLTAYTVSNLYRHAQEVRLVSGDLIEARHALVKQRAVIQDLGTELARATNRDLLRDMEAKVAEMTAKTERLNSETRDLEARLEAETERNKGSEASLKAVIAAQRRDAEKRAAIRSGELPDQIKSIDTLQAVLVAWINKATRKYGWSEGENFCMRKRLIDHLQSERLTRNLKLWSPQFLNSLRRKINDAASLRCFFRGEAKRFIDVTLYQEGNWLSQVRSKM